MLIAAGLQNEQVLSHISKMNVEANRDRFPGNPVVTYVPGAWKDIVLRQDFGNKRSGSFVAVSVASSSAVLSF